MIRRGVVSALLVAGFSWGACTATAATVGADVGQTHVFLNTDLMRRDLGLTFEGVSPDVISPGLLGPNVRRSFGFWMNRRNAATRPTTFSYKVAALQPVAGTLEHMGSLFYNNGDVEMGNFSVGYDAARVGIVPQGRGKLLRRHSFWSEHDVRRVIHPPIPV